MTKPLVSILIPAYNREELVKRAIESAINQTYENIEVIAVDNKSTDRTYKVLKEYAEKYPNVKVYQNKENLGPVRNWKKCLEYATGEYVKILFSDDLIDEKFIEKTLPFLVDDPGIGFVFTGTEIFNDETQQRKKSYFIGNTGKYDSQKCIEGSLLGGSLAPGISPGKAIFRKKDVENSLVIDIPNKLGIDFKMHGMGNDLLIFLLTAIKYPKFAFVNETLSFFRSHSLSITTVEYKLRPTRYNAAKAYFVENYVKDIKLEKKFNSILLLLYISNLIRRGHSIKSIKDFYLNKKYIKVSFLFIGKIILRKMMSLDLLRNYYVRG